MYKLANKEMIGRYLTECIDRRYDSHRKFCRAYLMERDGHADGESINRMSNRLSQILKGNKEIQLHDIPIFCQLLELSCDDILSAGEYRVPAAERLTNYTVALSRDASVWKKYLNRSDSPILNADEFGMTIIDYAIEAGNYGFLKYLTENKYIWFVGDNENDYCMTFGAGTSIENNCFPYPRNMNILDARMKMRDDLRTDMIALAIKNRDSDMLGLLHAREIPTLYYAVSFAGEPPKCRNYYNEKVMKALLDAEDDILIYFSEEFEISDAHGRKNKFVFPFLGELIEKTLEKKRTAARDMLKNAIRHNNFVYDRLKELMTESAGYLKNLGCDTEKADIKDAVTNRILEDYHIYDSGKLIKFNGFFSAAKEGLRSNITRVDAESEDVRTSRGIKELNNLYDAVKNITPRF